MTPAEQERRWWEYYFRHHRAINVIVAKHGGPSALLVLFSAVQLQDMELAANAMNAAWFRAPDAHGVYDEPGFQEMCNLLDGSAVKEE